MTEKYTLTQHQDKHLLCNAGVLAWLYMESCTLIKKVDNKQKKRKKEHIMSHFLLCVTQTPHFSHRQANNIWFELPVWSLWTDCCRSRQIKVDRKKEEKKANQNVISSLLNSSLFSHLSLLRHFSPLKQPGLTLRAFGCIREWKLERVCECVKWFGHAGDWLCSDTRAGKIYGFATSPDDNKAVIALLFH